MKDKEKKTNCENQAAQNRFHRNYRIESRQCAGDAGRIDATKNCDVMHIWEEEEEEKNTPYHKSQQKEREHWEKGWTIHELKWIWGIFLVAGPAQFLPGSVGDLVGEGVIWVIFVNTTAKVIPVIRQRNTKAVTNLHALTLWYRK